MQHLVDEQHVVPAGDDGAGIGGQALAVPEGAHLRHRLALLARAGADRRTEADHHLVAARPQPARPALGPVAARRHRVVGAADVDRHHVDAVVGGDHGGAGAHLADLPVARARPLGEHEQIPAVVDEAVDVVGGAVVEPAAVAAERHRVEEQRDAVGLPAAVVEVVGRRGHGGAAAPLEGDRAQDRRGVEVARVVGHEDDRRREPVEDLAPGGAAAEIPVRHRPEAVAQQRLASRPGVAAARPGDVELGVVPGHLRAALGQLGAAVAELFGAARRELGNALLELGHALLDLVGPRPALLQRAIDSAVPHAACTPRHEIGFATFSHAPLATRRYAE